MEKDYIFRYAGDSDVEEFICTAKNGDKAMEKFKKHVGIIYSIIKIIVVEDEKINRYNDVKEIN